MKKRKLLNGILSVVLVLSLVFSQFIFAPSVIEASAQEVEVWSGNAKEFAGGTGTSTDPFIIENADQLYWLVEEYDSYDNTKDKYFKITKDIYINDVSDGTPVSELSNKLNWLLAYGDTISTASKATSFSGTLDGDGHTIYGLYVENVLVSGLFPSISDISTIKNLNFENLFITGTKDGYAGAIAGQVIYSNWQKTAHITNCSVKDATIGRGDNLAFAGGLVGHTKASHVTLTNCYSKELTLSCWDGIGGGLVGGADGSGTLTLVNCYSVGDFPTNSKVSKTNCTNVYTNVAYPEGNTTVGITVLTDAQMKGEAAKTNLQGFDFGFTWETVENSYPTVRDEILPIWDGTKDTNLEGTGSVTDPYLIETASQLAAIVTSNNSGAFTGKYFKLVNDIRINDTSLPNWKSSARDWVWEDFRFIGTFDGNGHTIDGLYYEGDQRVMGLFSYVGADNNGTYQTTLKNFAMTNAYISSAATDGAGFAAGQASRVAYFDGIYIDDTCEITSTTVTGVGGILGQSGYNVFMSNCAMNGKLSGGSNVGAFIGTVSSGARLDIKSSYTTADLYAQGVTDRNLSTTSNAVYVVKKHGTIDAAATLLTLDQMKGENAKKYMPSLSFRFIWETVENDFPIYNPSGELWDGTCVTDFSSFKGNGTEESPYLIENGAQLAYAVAKSGTALAEAKHYKLVKDIILNDTSCDGWEASARGWVQNTQNRFNGEIDGDGHTIEGLYWNATSGGRYGLVAYSGKLASGNTHVATFKNITFTGASINNSAANAGASEGAAIVVGQASGETIFENIYIDETCKINAPNVKGVAGLVGRGYNEGSKAHVTISNCAVLADITGGSHVGAFTGTFWDTAVVITANNSFAVTNTGLIASTVGSVVLDKVYTTTVGAEDTGAEEVEVANMKGEAAKENMSGFDFYCTWETVENGYPVLRKDIIEAWGGAPADTSAIAYAGGDGTKASPFKIENGDQLYKMVAENSNQTVSTAPETQFYFEITADINLGSKQWFASSASSWISNASYDTIGFNGIIYGNGHTIYNLYSNVVAGAAGLIPVATQNAEIRDLHLVGGYLPRNSYKSYALGGLIGLAKGVSGSKPITISGCSVKGFNIVGVNGAAGLVGYTYSQSLNIKDSYVTDSTFVIDAGDSAALVGTMGGNDYNNSFIIENCYCDTSAVPVMNDNFKAATTFNNVYTTLETYDDSISGLKKVTAAEITGNTAKENLEGYNFNQIWKTVDGEYPVHQSMEDRAKAWDGTIADGFADGEGTAAAPYLISNASELYLLANSDRETTLGKYYKLTNDIAISNVYDNWENENPYSWTKQKALLDGFAYTSSFAGVLDGAGYTVSGLYCEDAITDNGTYAYGLIPYATASAIIRNLNVENVNINVTGNAYAGAVVGAAHVSVDDAENPLKYVNFVDVNVSDCDITATNSSEILGGATRGVKFNRCDGETLADNKENKIFNLECNKGLAVDNSLVVYNNLNADANLFTTVQQALLNNQELNIVDINCVEGFDITELVAIDECINAKTPEESLVWSQEFNGDALDYSVWSQNTTMSKKSNLIYADNSTVANNILKLECKDTGDDDTDGNNIYSVNYGLSTLDTMSFKYGRLEMRAKIPFGAGAFPSLWLTSRNAIGNAAINPYDAEIDIFEVFGKTDSQNKMVACIHKWYNDENGDRLWREGKDGEKIYDVECSCGTGNGAGNAYKIEESNRSHEMLDSKKEDWHTIVFEWTEDVMTFSVDETVYYTAKKSDMDNASALFGAIKGFNLSGYDTDNEGLFNQYMYLRLNNHMYTPGGSKYVYDGAASEIDASKLNYEIDYIRLYQKNDGKSQINLK